MFDESWLGPDLGAEVVWKATDAPLPDSYLMQLARDQWDINKFTHYIPVYEKVFKPFRDRPVNMLEIGVNLGGSMELWWKYFRFGYWGGKIVGIDNNPKCVVFDAPDKGIHVRVGAQQDPVFLQRVVDEFGPFDIILDDGSHIPSFTLKSFQYLFPNGLAEGGAYLVEDLFSCYVPDGLEPFAPRGIPEADDGSPPFVEFAKSLIDYMHVVYLQTPSGEQVADAFEPGNPARRSEFSVPRATTIISGIEFYDSIVVIRKGNREVPRIIRRWSTEGLKSIVRWNPKKLWTKYPHLGEAEKTRRDWASSMSQERLFFTGRRQVEDE